MPAIQRRSGHAAVWWILGLAWIAAWLLFLFGSARLRGGASLVLLFCMAVFAVLKWRDRRPIRSKED